MKAARVRPAEVDAFIMRPLCKANKVPTGERGAKRKDKKGAGRVLRCLKSCWSPPAPCKVPFPPARDCRSGWMEAAWEMQGVDAGTANHGISLFRVWMLKIPQKALSTQ